MDGYRIAEEHEQTESKHSQVNTLTYDEHKKLEEILVTFTQESKEFFNLIKKRFGKKSLQTKHAAKAINNIQSLKYPLIDGKDIDRVACQIPYEEKEWMEWHQLYQDWENFMTDGYY